MFLKNSMKWHTKALEFVSSEHFFFKKNIIT